MRGGGHGRPGQQYGADQHGEDGAVQSHRNAPVWPDGTPSGGQRKTVAVRRTTFPDEGICVSRQSRFPRNVPWRARHGAPQVATPAGAGVALMQLPIGCDQNVMLQLSILPTSPPALSFTRNFHVPFNASLDRFLVNVPITLSVLLPVRLWML